SEAGAAVSVVEVEALDCSGAPVVAYGDDVVRGALVVEDLGERGGLQAVVVVGWGGGFGGVAEAQEVEEEDAVGEGEEVGNRAGPEPGAVWEAVAED
ncbi:hypothetical protein LTR48_008941, partial [Friedmanniomyces endolithicus]